MSDEPRDAAGNGEDQAVDQAAGSTRDGVTSTESGGSAPWERPRRWNQDPLDATRVDDLLARLGSTDDAPPEGRRRRRAADDAVPASELIAALSADAQHDTADLSMSGASSADPTPATSGPTETSPATDHVATHAVVPAAPAVAAPVAQPLASAPDASAAPAETQDDATVFLSPGWSADSAGGAPGSAVHSPGAIPQDDNTVLLPPRIGPDDQAPIRDLGDGPRTDFIPKLTGNAADRAEADSIREALRRQSRFDNSGATALGAAAAADQAGPPTPAHPRHPGGRPARRHSGWLYAGRSIAALVAVITLLGVGVEWKIKDRADVGLHDNSIPAINLADPNIASARTTQKVVTNSAGVKTTEAAKAATTYAPENILLLGSDTRSGGNAAIGGSDSSTNGTANSDTLMVAHISGDRQHVTILSIPRDTIIPAPSCKVWDATTGKVSDQNNDISPGQTYHINSAYSVGGPKCTVTAVQSLTGLGINRMIGIDFSGFEAMVNALGGITVDICRPIVDTVLGTVMPTAGVQRITGAQAINLVRARDVIGDTESDLARIHRQQVVLSAILRQVTQAGTLLNPSKLDNFLQAFTKNTFTDNVNLEDLVTLAGSLGSLDPAHVTFYTLPTVPSTTISGALDVDTAKASVVLDDLVNDLPLPGESTAATTKATTTPQTPAPTTAPAAPSLKLTVSPAKVDLEVYNVTGQANVAGDAQQKLNAVGFDIADSQLYKPDNQDQTGTTVMYAPANRAAALTVAAAVPGSTLVVTPGLGSTVRLMLGSSFDGTVSAVKVGDQAPASLSTAISTGSSVATTAGSAAATSLASTALSSVNAGAGTCA